MMISIVIPTLGQINKLQKLFCSLRLQKQSGPYEVLLCATGVDAAMTTKLPQLQMPVRFIVSPEKCISFARNRGIENARGGLILFLDDDCELPNDHYLDDLNQAFRKNAELCGGGFYLNPKNHLSFFSQFYNFVCNFWLYANQTSSSAQVLLGGVSFYSSAVLKKHHIRFSAFYKKAGEEYEFNHGLVLKNYRLELNSRWSVFHNAECSFKNVLKKAWVQGSAINQKPAAVQLKLWKFIKIEPLQTLSYLPFLALYYFVGRVAGVRETFFKNLPDTPNKAHTISAVHGYKIPKEL